ncbi:hypothetical protein [Paenibacillus sp. FSL H8-0034]
MYYRRLITRSASSNRMKVPEVQERGIHGAGGLRDSQGMEIPLFPM